MPLQAADVIAYELFKFIKNEAVDRHKRKVRYSALDLFRDTDTSLLKYFDRKTFESILKMRVPGWDI